MILFRILLFLGLASIIGAVVVLFKKKGKEFEEKYNETKRYINTATDAGSCFARVYDLKQLAFTNDHRIKIVHLEGIIKQKFNLRHEFRGH